MVHQHFKLVPTLSVAENYALATGSGVGLVRRAMVREMEAVAETLGWKVEAGRTVGTLSVGEQQRVEIIKALGGMGRMRNAQCEVRNGVLILDEPTAVLTPGEAGELMRAMKALARRGMGVVFITHKLGEVREVCDEVTILRRGEKVYAGEVRSSAEMARMMVGEEGESGKGRGESDRGCSTELTGARNLGPVLLEIAGARAGRKLSAASLAVRGGEIVGVAGVDGNGQGELVGAIVGTMELTGGAIRIGGEDAGRKSVRWRVERMAYIPEDRREQALALGLSVMENLVLKGYREPAMSPWGWVNKRAWRARASELVQRFDVRCGSLADRVGMLSGGNQQKVVLARELGSGLNVVVAVNPTRGLDVGATAFVMRELKAARERGAAVLLVHSDLDELLAMSDRVYVMYGGTLRESAGKTKEEIGRMMVGGTM